MKEFNVGDRILNYGVGYGGLRFKWLTIGRVTEKMIYFDGERSLGFVSQIAKDRVDLYTVESGLVLRDDMFSSDMSFDELDTLMVGLHEKLDEQRSIAIRSANDNYESAVTSIREFREANR